MELNDLKNLKLDDVFHAIGVQRRSESGNFLPVVGAFAVGTAIGGLLGLLLAPKSGEELRKDIGEKMEDVLKSETASAKSEKIGRAHV